MCHSQLVLASPRHFYGSTYQSTKFSSTTWSPTCHLSHFANSTSRFPPANSVVPARTRTSPDHFSPSKPYRTVLGHAFCLDRIHLLTLGSLNVRNPRGLFEVVLKTEEVLSVVRRTVRDHLSDQDLQDVLIGVFGPAGMLNLVDESSCVYQTLFLLSCRRTSVITLLASPRHRTSHSLGSVALDLFLKGDTALGVRTPKNRLCAEKGSW